MKEFFVLLKKGDLKAIFTTPTQNGFLQFFRYLFVGGVATVVDWGMLFMLTEFAHIHYLISTVLAFIGGLATNFLLSKQLVFKANEARVSPLIEFLSYALIGVIGLGITELIMVLFTNHLDFHYMISKVIATVIVLLWNYMARRYAIYK